VILPGSVVGPETSAIVSMHGQLYVNLPLAAQDRDKAAAPGADKSPREGGQGDVGWHGVTGLRGSCSYVTLPWLLPTTTGS